MSMIFQQISIIAMELIVNNKRYEGVIKMDWNTLVIEKSYGIVTDNNIDEFNCEFWERLNDNHDSNLPAGAYVTFKMELFGMKLEGHYIAEWIGDDEYPNETEPGEIELDSIITGSYEP